MYIACVFLDNNWGDHTDYQMFIARRTGYHVLIARRTNYHMLIARRTDYHLLIEHCIYYHVLIACRPDHHVSIARRTDYHMLIARPTDYHMLITHRAGYRVFILLFTGESPHNPWVGHGVGQVQVLVPGGLTHWGLDKKAEVCRRNLQIYFVNETLCNSSKY